MTAVFQYCCIIHSPEFQKFLSTKDNHRLILLDTPTHGNLGDQAIVLAEKKFLQENFTTNDIYEFTQCEYVLCEKRICRSLNLNDVILINGGGFIGTLWQNEEDVFLRILNRLCLHKIVVFPQTVFFEKSDKRILEEEKLKKALEKCNDLTLFIRDFQSYEFMIKKMGMSKKQCIYVPDIVTYLEYEGGFKRKNRVVFCLRNDKEKVFNEKRLQQILEELEKKNFQIVHTDTVVNQRIYKSNREKKVWQKLDEFAQAKLVITDRLHGMLFSAITSTPCIAVDNVSRKVSGGFEWIKDLDYVKCVQECELNTELVMDMLDYSGSHYSNKDLRQYYQIMRECICGSEVTGNSHYER